MTPHNSAKKENIKKTVIMPGDPKRAKYIADKFLENVKLVNDVRGMNTYTGTYKGKEVTIMPSGMGMPSMGIYAYELFNFYDVDNIIRIGTCGSLKKEIPIKKIILASSSYTLSNFSKEFNGKYKDIEYSSPNLNEKVKEAAKKLDIDLTIGTINTSDLFYKEKKLSSDKYDLLAVEMESFALFYLANHFGKNATSILTVSDNIITNESISAIEREKNLDMAINLALETL